MSSEYFLLQRVECVVSDKQEDVEVIGVVGSSNRKLEWDVS